MIRRPPRSTRPHTLFPYTTLFRTQALLASTLRPVQRRALRVGIEQDNRLPAHRQFAGNVGGERGLSDTAFLVQDGGDHGAALPAGKPAWPCRWVVVHRSGVLLPKVRAFKLGKLERPQTHAVIGFPAFSYS